MILNLPYPHGFLISRGEQKAIASDVLIESKEVTVVTDNDVFGIATLSEPVQTNVKEFHSREYQKLHKMKPSERRFHWKDANVLYVYRLENWEPSNGTKMHLAGEIVDIEPLLGIEHEIAENSDQLPKKITLQDAVVTFDGKHYNTEYLPEYIKEVLEATYQNEVELSDEPQSLPLYELALVKIPNIQLKKSVNVKQEDNMPWEIEKRDNEFCVIKVDNGESEGCHDTREEAQDQLAALNIAEGESDTEIKLHKESMTQTVDRISQQFADMFSEPDDFGFWTRDIFDSHIIASDDGILFRVNYMDTESGEVIFASRPSWVEVEIAYIDKAATLLKHFDNISKPKDETVEVNKSWFDDLRQSIKSIAEFVGFKKDEVVPNKDMDFSDNQGVIIKTINGKPWHFTWSTNAFIDRDGEIFSTKALENYVTESQTQQDKKDNKESRGTFDFWHIPGTDFAEKEWQGVVGRFLIEAGPYIDNEIGQKAQEFFKEFPDGHPDISPEGWGASPQFRFRPEDLKDGIYNWLWITKTSTLPRAAAANIFTEGTQIMLENNQELQDAANKIWGKEITAGIIAKGVKMTKELETANVAHKEVDGEKPVTEDKSQEVNIDIDELAKALGEQFSVDLGPIQTLLQGTIETVETLQTKMTKFETQEKVQADAETPRQTWTFVKRAIDAVETQVNKDDKLLEMKPVENKGRGQDDVMDSIFNNG